SGPGHPRRRSQGRAHSRMLRVVPSRPDGAGERGVPRAPHPGCHPGAGGGAEAARRRGPGERGMIEYQPLLLAHAGRATPLSLQDYRAEGGYEGWAKALKEMDAAAVTEEVKSSGLR